METAASFEARFAPWSYPADLAGLVPGNAHRDRYSLAVRFYLEQPNARSCSRLSLSWFCFEYPDVPNHQSVASNRVYPGQDEARCLKKRSPFALATFFTAGHSKHVEVAHQVACQLRIWMRDERRKDEFNDQQTAVLRNYRVAVLENSNSIPVLTPVQYMLEHVYIGPRRDRLRQICGNQFASGGSIFIREARFGCIHAGFEVYKHASQMRVESKHCKNERPTAAAEVGDHLRAGKIPRFSDRRVIFCRSRTHHRAKNRISLGILRPPGRYFRIADLRGRLTGPNTVGEQGPVVGKQIRPEDDG